MKPVIQVRNVTKTYQGSAGAAALDRVSIDIYPGEVTLLMGPSGSGKTTLISIMGAILRPTSGQVIIAGTDISKLGEGKLPELRRRHIGFIFQSFNLMPTLTAAENVELALELRGFRGASARRLVARALLDEVGLNEKYGSLPEDLSGGQKQRVAIARAIASNPDIVLADEPTAALDSVSGRMVMDKLRDLARNGRAVLIVTHDNRILDYASRIIQIEDGRIVTDTSAKAVTRYAPARVVPRKQAKEEGSPLMTANRAAGPRLYQISFVVLVVLVTAWIGSEYLAVDDAPPAATGGPLTALAQTDTKPGPMLVSAAGRVEPASEELKISSQLAGRLISVPVQEGQRLAEGQTIAVLDGGDLNARAAQAEATVQLRQAELDRLTNGPTIYEKQAAANAVAEAKAVLENAKAEMLQRKSLFESGDISNADYQRSEREVELDQIKLDKANVNSASLDSPAREDETARAQASLRAAREQVAEARALLDQTVVRAPFSGTVLKKYHSAGEEVGVVEPIVSFGDVSRLIVRVDVDETDVAKVRVGQRAYFTAQAYGTKRFSGTVLRLGGQLGRKTIESDDPSEKEDTKVLETLVVLDGHPALPVGLRLDAFIEVGSDGR